MPPEQNQKPEQPQNNSPQLPSEPYRVSDNNYLPPAPEPLIAPPKPLPLQPNQQSPEQGYVYRPLRPRIEQPRVIPRPYLQEAPPEEQPNVPQQANTPPPPTLQDYAYLDKYGRYSLATKPVAAPRKPGKSPVKAIILSLAVLVLLGFTAAAAFLAVSSFTNNSPAVPDASFNIAIEKRLETKLIKQTYEVEQDYDFANIKLRIEAFSDFSDPANPKTKGSYVTDLSSKVGEGSGQAKADFIMPNKNEVYIKYTSIPNQDTSIPKSIEGKWLLLDDEYAWLLYDPIGISRGFNTPLGEIITGNFTGSLRSTIMNRINTDAIYTITSNKKELLNNQHVIKYDVDLESDKILALNEYITEQLKLPSSESLYRMQSKKFTAWVDSSTGKIIKVFVSQNDTSNTMTYSYPSDKLEVNAPAEFIKSSALLGTEDQQL